jgi:hypothetical protein
VNRLEGQWPLVAEALGALPAEARLAVSQRAAAQALAANDLPPLEGDREAVEAEVGRLDTVAWDIQDDEASPPEAYDVAFQRARAANAYLLAEFGGTPEEVVYEALHALGAPEDGRFLLDEPVA